MGSVGRDNELETCVALGRWGSGGSLLIGFIGTVLGTLPDSTVTIYQKSSGEENCWFCG